MSLARIHHPVYDLLPMAESSPGAKRFYADPEHSGLRLAIPLLVLVGFVASYILLFVLLRQALAGSQLLDYLVVLACLGALPASLLFTVLAERWLRRVWRSGREIVVQGDEVRLIRREAEDIQVQLDRPVDITRWRFQLGEYQRAGRERHLSGDWFCLACQLRQEGDTINFFTFMPPEQMEEMDAVVGFRRIWPRDVYESSLSQRMTGPARPKLPPQVITGRDGRYWLAERNRWHEGVELEREEFKELIWFTSTLSPTNTK